MGPHIAARTQAAKREMQALFTIIGGQAFVGSAGSDRSNSAPAFRICTLLLSWGLGWGRPARAEASARFCNETASFSLTPL
ncbi:hypothetical protein AX760_04250 [Pararhizobium antarcticum]|uniref:Uncharacterized protein n=1 Tax=Pararhizobium antarcticum TaxID=1798805 RepID=A0A657LRL9_9HYPH|nr:hypothetical protein AX760_04250 [Pararhizobium antarcticum]OJF98135.1 hypothetical protein AX761_13040 [Rhizobium sp. 58]